MYSGDRVWALVALLTLWGTYLFVLMKVIPICGGSAELYVLATGAGLVLLFNTAAIYSMLTHYGEDKQNIYGLDIHYLDLAKKSHN
jgi:hypothetical protein